MPWSARPLCRLAVAVLAVLWVLPPPTAAAADKPSRREIERHQKEAIAALPEKHREWLAEIHPLLTGDEKAQRFDTLITGNVASVTFALNGKPILTKRKPPYSVELDLGTVPHNHLLTATAVDAAGRELANDQIQINTAPHRLIAYQSTNNSGGNGFRTVEVEVARSGVEVKTLRGYYT